MVKHLHWTVGRVALASLFLLWSAAAFAQSSQITYTCHATPLETVLTQIAKQSGYDFMYSRNFVDISKPVTLSVSNKSINDVLGMIETQASISFKLHDRHIIIKNNPKPVIVAAPKQIER